ncbi:hypothetical protein QG37_06528 [Candidozyma auris]|uniref:Uncharacterized protein n=1 Tax=Candidozyma auris TaxID=498019 RepID=A0A0L0NSR0_CANAR|nr:hypothetical protein QG37_06528 [[Candida] auris]
MQRIYDLHVFVDPFYCYFRGIRWFEAAVDYRPAKEEAQVRRNRLLKKRKNLLFSKKKKKGKVDSFSGSMHGRTPKKFCVKDRTFHVAYFLGRASGGGSFRLGSAE